VPKEKKENVRKMLNIIVKGAIDACRNCVLWDGLHLFSLVLLTCSFVPRRFVGRVRLRLCSEAHPVSHVLGTVRAFRQSKVAGA
jgi:hypothetical protein